jgi:hypothetical protein
MAQRGTSAQRCSALFRPLACEAKTAYFARQEQRGTTNIGASMKRQYTASKTRTNRPGWTITLRHPLRKDGQGKPGLKVRRGLGTTDEVEADWLVAQMNELLADESWWSASKRSEAERRFHDQIVKAFYDDLVSVKRDSWAVRSESIPLPGSEDGYSRVMLVGTTGAGKTSLLRHLIGSDPERDRFPSTSTAKTTIADTEVVAAEGPYSAVVTFFSEHQTQAAIEDCLLDACKSAAHGRSEQEVANALLNHRDQRFRLSYLFGSYATVSPHAGDEWDFEQEPSEEPEAPSSLLSAEEQANNRMLIDGFLTRIYELARSTREAIESELGLALDSATGDDRDTLEDLFEETLTASEPFTELALDILDATKSKFDLAGEGISRTRSGWPDKWTFESDDREGFLEKVRGFSSNYAPLFGRLLTPLVDGIRVKGPLFPTFQALKPNVVLMDGEGLGHTPDSSSSVTTRITRRFDDVDVIVLVDNAQQPMQAAPLAVLRSLAASGHYSKLAIAFTHFDLVKGDNLPSFSDKRAHVMAAVTNALSGLRDSIGAPVVRAIETNLEHRCFMLGALNWSSRKLPTGPVNELLRLLRFCAEQIGEELESNARPIYDTAGLLFAIQAAANDFQRPWAARLGLAIHDGVSKEHWSRIKALNRRIAGETDWEYQHLRPVADFIGRLQEHISRFLETPIRWNLQPADDEEAQAVISQVRRAAFTKLHEIAFQRLIEKELPLWRKAYDHRGSGSTWLRARDIATVYEEAMPVPGAGMTVIAKEFLSEIRNIVESAIVEAGAKVESGVI